MNSKALLFGLGLVLVAFCLSGCVPGGNPTSPSVAKATAANIVYSKDVRSGLCFGTVTSIASPPNSVVSITNVPCEAVEKLLVK